MYFSDISLQYPITIHTTPHCLYFSIGRKKALAITIVIQVTLGVCVSFSPSYTVFAVLRFLLASANIAVFTTAFVLGKSGNEGKVRFKLKHLKGIYSDRK